MEEQLEKEIQELNLQLSKLLSKKEEMESKIKDIKAQIKSLKEDLKSKRQRITKASMKEMRLNAIGRQIIALRLRAQGSTYTYIGSQLNVSSSRARQICRRGGQILCLYLSKKPGYDYEKYGSPQWDEDLKAHKEYYLNKIKEWEEHIKSELNY